MVVPIPIRTSDQSNFPGPEPMLDVLLAANGRDDIVMPFEPYQAVDAISPCEALQLAGSVLVDPTHDIRRDPGVEDPVRPIGDDVDPAALHDANCGWRRFPVR